MLPRNIKKRLNLIRAVASNDWGASKQTLLTIYRVLIRSVMDYGVIAYDSAANTHLAKLDRIQYQALKIAFGAMKGTLAEAINVECDELPLQSDVEKRRSNMVLRLGQHPTTLFTRYI